MGKVDRDFGEAFTSSQRLISIGKSPFSHFEPVF